MVDQLWRISGGWSRSQIWNTLASLNAQVHQKL